MLRRRLKNRVRPFVTTIRLLRARLRYSGRDRYCPICDQWWSRFKPFVMWRSGRPPEPGDVSSTREDVLCPFCGSLERHRLVWLFLTREKAFLTTPPAAKMLHIAPEVFLQRKIRPLLKDRYLTADLAGIEVDVKMDVTDIHFPNGAFEVILCSHVLEHVPDDRKAMRELRRVLAKDGWAILVVPIRGDETIEDPTVTDPKERERLFGQDDHLRSYGAADYQQRLETAGFRVERIRPDTFLSAEEIARMRITAAAGDIYLCR